MTPNNAKSVWHRGANLAKEDAAQFDRMRDKLGVPAGRLILLGLDALGREIGETKSHHGRRVPPPLRRPA
jgi:hypothetical protein